LESVLFLVAGIVLTAWPDLLAEWLPDSLRFRVALAIVLGWPALRFWWLWKRSRQDEILV
jgi:membrane protein DedA with SNARE-associated domain